ncbi:MAG: ribonuclease PH [Chloroflexi bacterium]|nr:ribonuclease PH [Chloroflexota bacterium]
MRLDHRRNNELRPVKITPGYLDYPAGSVLIEAGKTRVLCAVTVQPGVPRWLEGRAQGWLTAEYAMLPASTNTRTPRETTPSARSQEIRRLIGRSLRAAVDLGLIGEHTITIDCDVIQADGGTRTASITGAYVALAMALRKMIKDKTASPRALKANVAAVSVGIVNGEEMLDLCYAEDSRAEVDFNIVMTGEGKFIEVQGTAEGEPFARDAMDRLVNLAREGIGELMKIQNAVISGQ